MGLSGGKGSLSGGGSTPGGGGGKTFPADPLLDKLQALKAKGFGAGGPAAGAAGRGLGGLGSIHSHPIGGFDPGDPRAPVKPPPRRPGLPERLLQGVGRALSSPDLGTRLAMAQALANGDTGAAARLGLELAEMREQRTRVRTAGARRKSAFNNLVKQGMSPGDAELAMLDPEGFGTAFNSRFRGPPPAGQGAAAAVPQAGGDDFAGTAEPGQPDEEEGAVAIGAGGRLCVVRGGRWVPLS